MSSNARWVQLSEELAESIKELQSMEEHRAESKVEIKKVISLCSWRVGKALVESAIPCEHRVSHRGCSALLAKHGWEPRPGMMWKQGHGKGREQIWPRGDREVSQASVHGCAACFV